MSLRRKMLLLLTVGFLAAFAADGVIEKAVVLPRFVALDQQRASRDFHRVREAIAVDLDQLAQNARSYGEWDDAYDFLQNRQPAFVRSNLPVEALGNLNADWIAYVDLAGLPAASQQKDSLKANPIDTVALFATLDLTANPQSPSITAPQGKSGFVRDGDRLLLVGSYPVVDSLGTQPMRGHVVLARVLTPKDIERIQRQTSVSFTLLPLNGETLSPQDDPPSAGESGILVQEKPDVLLTRAFLKDPQGLPLAMIEAKTPRETTAQGEAAMASEGLWTLISMGVMLVLAYVTMGIVILRPLRSLAKSVNWIRQSGELTHRLGIRTNDELGELARDVDLLLAQLARARAARLRSENQLNEVIREQREVIRRLSEANQSAHADA
jgi:sensor domain CHASE-containing protein